MRRDSGVLIVGSIFSFMGLLSCLKGWKGDAISIMHQHSNPGSSNITTPGFTIVVGCFLIVVGIYLISQSGYLRGKD